MSHGDEDVIFQPLVVLAKSESTRCRNKNYRPFSGQDSLVDILIQKLKRVASPSRIFLSCDDEARQSVAESHGVQWIKRPAHLAAYHVDLGCALRGIAEQVYESSELASGSREFVWCFPTDPLFDQHGEFLWHWKQVKESGPHDSMTVAYRDKAFRLNQDFQPTGWEFSPVPHSHQLPESYSLHFPITVIQRSALEATGHLIGEQPAWFTTSSLAVDINTEKDFRLAQVLYRNRAELELPREVPSHPPDRYHQSHYV